MNIALRAVEGLLPGPESSRSGVDLAGGELTNEALAELMVEVRRAQRRLGVADDRPICDQTFPEERVGVRSRRILDAGLGVRDMARCCARRALGRARIDPVTVRCVIVSSVSAESSVPSVASGIQADLGLGTDVVAFDISVGCSGFVVAVDVAAHLLDGMPDGSTAVVAGSTSSMPPGSTLPAARPGGRGSPRACAAGCGPAAACSSPTTCRRSRTSASWRATWAGS